MANEPRTVTLDQINAEIASEHYFTALDGVLSPGGSGRQTQVPPIPDPAVALGLLTFCVLILRNGFTVTGQSACADPAKFNAEMGRKLAREDAVRQCWKLLGFRLRDQIAAEQGAAPAAKRYTSDDIVRDSIRWATTAGVDDLFDNKLSYSVRMRDGREIRGGIQLTDDGSPWPNNRVAAACARHALAAANGEAP